MNKSIKRVILSAGIAIMLSPSNTCAQSFEWISSMEGNVWQQSKVKLQTNAKQAPLLDIDGSENGTVFKAWGTCFNELGWDALNMLPRNQQEKILHQLFSPDGDLRFTMGRFSIILAYIPAKEKKTPVMVISTPQQKQVVIAGNFNDEAKEVTLKLGKI